MLQFIFYTLLFVAAAFLFLPYLKNLITYLSTGLDHIATVVYRIIDFVTQIFNSLSGFYYLNIFLVILLSLALIFYIINSINGGKK